MEKHSIAIIRNCQRNCLRKMATLTNSGDSEISAGTRALINSKMKEAFSNLKYNKVTDLISDTAREYGIQASGPDGGDFMKAVAAVPELHNALRRSKFKAYAPWAVGGAIAGGGLGGWIGNKYGSTLLGVLLGGLGGGVAGWGGKGLYERYFNDNRYNRALRATEATMEAMDVLAGDKINKLK